MLDLIRICTKEAIFPTSGFRIGPDLRGRLDKAAGSHGRRRSFVRCHTMLQPRQEDRISSWHGVAIKGPSEITSGGMAKPITSLLWQQTLYPANPDDGGSPRCVEIVAPGRMWQQRGVYGLSGFCPSVCTEACSCLGMSGRRI